MKVKRNIFTIALLILGMIIAVFIVNNLRDKEELISRIQRAVWIN